MKKLLLLFIPIILLGAGCLTGTNQISTTPSVNQQTKTVLIDEQAKCATQSEKVLSTFKTQQTGSPFSNFIQENHYNKTMDKCFTYISYNGPIYNGNNGSYWILKDAFENSDLAACSYNLNAKNPGAYCFITGGPGALSQEEIDDFINQRMERLPRS